ncbi:MAG: dihydroorotase, partial [Reichenbachiella sp.]
IQGELDMMTWIEKLTSRPRAILKLPAVSIEEKKTANLTVFDPKAKWILDDQTNQSKSRNSPFFDRELTGKVKAVINGEQFQIFE